MGQNLVALQHSTRSAWLSQDAGSGWKLFPWGFAAGARNSRHSTHSSEAFWKCAHTCSLKGVNRWMPWPRPLALTVNYTSISHISGTQRRALGLGCLVSKPSSATCSPGVWGKLLKQRGTSVWGSAGGDSWQGAAHPGTPACLCSWAPFPTPCPLAADHPRTVLMNRNIMWATYVIKIFSWLQKSKKKLRIYFI